MFTTLNSEHSRPEPDVFCDFPISRSKSCFRAPIPATSSSSYGKASFNRGDYPSITTTNEIADKIATEQNLTKVQAKAIVESVFKQIADAAQAGAETSIPSFGKFKVKDTPEREGRNPATGATIKIAASKKMTFAPGKALKDALNG
jgi:DNA-binding protein HU-beta